jgi:AraC-like DNA-binding protein
LVPGLELPIRTNSICVLLACNGKIRLGLFDRELSLVANQLLLVRLRQPCKILKTCNGPHIQIVSFSRAFALEHTRKKAQSRFLSLLIAEKLPKRTLEGRKLGVLPLLFRILALKKEGEYLQQEQLVEGFNMLVLELLELYAPYLQELTVEGHFQKNRLVMGFLVLVERHYKQWHKVHFYAKKLYVTPNYLSKEVRSVTGKSAKTSIHEALLREAKLLLRTDRAIGTIGEELGFGSPSVFSRFFRSHTKLSPTGYREKLMYG